MPTDLIWRDQDPYHDDRITQDMYVGQHLAGFAWYTDVGTKRFWGDRGLSKHYLAYTANYRPPICILIPTKQGGQVTFLLDGHPTDKPDEGWDVTVDLATLIEGQKPLITVMPSINCVGLYHGWLKDGTLSDDLG